MLNVYKARISQRDPDTVLFEGPSVSGLAPVSCAIGALGVANCASANPSGVENLQPQAAELLSPNSAAPTTPQSPTVPPLDTMPSKAAPPPLATTTTTAEICNDNRFAILGKLMPPETYDTYDEAQLLNSSISTSSSAGTTTSPTTVSCTSSDSPPKFKQHSHNNNHQHDLNSIESTSDVVASSSGELKWIDELIEKRATYSASATSEKLQQLDELVRQHDGDDVKVTDQNLDWIDDLINQRHAAELLRRSKPHKKKKRHVISKELDQLDGVPTKEMAEDLAATKSLHSTTSEEEVASDDDKVVKCLYYTLMCCDCSIS